MKKYLSKKSFTLIEMLIVMTIVGLMLPASFFILTKILEQQLKIYKMVETKREGDYILNTIKDTIRRDAVSITKNDGPPTYTWTSACSGGAVWTYETTPTSLGQDIRYINKSGPTNYFQFFQSGNSLYFNTNGSAVAMNSNKFIIETAGFSSGCYKYSTVVPAIIRIGFRITYNDEFKADPLKATSMWYHTRIRLRNR